MSHQIQRLQLLLHGKLCVFSFWAYKGFLLGDAYE